VTSQNAVFKACNVEICGPVTKLLTNDRMNHKRAQYEQRRGKLQQTGTRSAHLTIKSIGSAFSEWSLDWLHNRANDLIAEAHNADVDGIIFENLDHIRENIANGSRFQQWAYAKFVELVEYKVESTALFVDSVNNPTLLRSGRRTATRLLRVGLVGGHPLMLGKIAGW
jgi:IS605 OrfB family transposase